MSIVSCALLIENLANACVEHVRISNRLRGRVDEWPSLDKLEFVLREINSKVPFDRGSPTVQQMAELIGVRNNYVHPRVAHRSKLKPMLPHLKIPESSLEWDAASAEKVLRAVLTFLKVYLVDWCAISRIQRTFLLRSEIQGDDGGWWALFRQDALKHLETLEKDLRVDLNFLGLKAHGKEAT